MNSLVKNKNFFKAGKAIFTISNSTGDHYTYRIKRGMGDAKHLYFIGLLTGPNNGRDYTYMGLYNPEQCDIKLTQKSKYDHESKPVRVVRWAMLFVQQEKELPSGYSLQHEGCCGRCGRSLTTPESIDNGIGPECIKKIR